METPAERFYVASHIRNAQRSGSESLKPRTEVLKELSQRNTRYHCVYKYLSENGNLSVAELGFGSDEIAAALADRTHSYHIVDVVDRRSSRKLPDNVAFTKADLDSDFPFRDQEFDCVVAMMVIEHLFDPFHSFAEISRITRKRGKIFINLPNIAAIKCRVQLLAGQMPVTSSRDWFEKTEWDGNHLHYFTVSDTTRIAEKFGLQLDALHPVGKLYRLKTLRPSLFCAEISYEFSRH